MATTVVSAGLLLCRVRDGQPEFLLGHMGGPFWARKDKHAWSIPKGELLPNEDPLEAARREFTEELGVDVPAGVDFMPLGEVRQRSGKRVIAWAVETEFEIGAITGNTFELEWPPRSGRMQSFPELDRVEWFAVDVVRVKIVAAQAEFLDRWLTTRPTFDGPIAQR